MLIGSSSRVYEKPTTGVYDAVFADYIDLGNVPSTFQGKTTMKHKVRLVWILSAKDTEGNNFRLFQRVTASMGKKATLFAIVKDVLGQVPQLTNGNYNLEELIGKNAQLVVARETAEDGNEYANIKAILPAKAAFLVPPSFIRDKDRTDKDRANVQTTAAQTATQPQQASAGTAVAVAEEDIPF